MKAHTLILTLEIEEAPQLCFTELRSKYFPKHCNYLDAHITLFHRLPDDERIENILQQFTDRQEIELEIAAVKNIGNGVAFTIQSAALQALHMELQKSFSEWLIPQDRNKLWPHVTIQNKVTAYKAKQTADFLQQDFRPFIIKTIGISSWIYLGGPWEKKATYLFQK